MCLHLCPSCLILSVWICSSSTGQLSDCEFPSKGHSRFHSKTERFLKPPCRRLKWGLLHSAACQTLWFQFESFSTETHGGWATEAVCISENKSTLIVQSSIVPRSGQFKSQGGETKACGHVLRLLQSYVKNADKIKYICCWKRPFPYEISSCSLRSGVSRGRGGGGSDALGYSQWCSQQFSEGICSHPRLPHGGATDSLRTWTQQFWTYAAWRKPHTNVQKVNKTK